jgi:hypothetical protein
MPMLSNLACGSVPFPGAAESYNSLIAIGVAIDAN